MTASDQYHPDEEDLIVYVVEREPSEKMELHLLGCDICQARLESILHLRDAQRESSHTSSPMSSRVNRRLHLIKPDPEDSE